VNESALSAEEWAAFPNGHLIRAARIMETGIQPKDPYYFPTRAGIAAVNLHGRLTWAMVDAIRGAAYGYTGGDFVGRGGAVTGDVLDEAADLLEELLPPRDMI